MPCLSAPLCRVRLGRIACVLGGCEVSDRAATVAGTVKYRFAVTLACWCTCNIKCYVTCALGDREVSDRDVGRARDIQGCNLVNPTVQHCRVALASQREAASCCAGEDD